MKAKQKITWDYLWYALYAFAGLGIELLLAGFVEPLWVGQKSFSQYTTAESIIHWLLTCLCWGVMILLLTHFSKSKLQFEWNVKKVPQRSGVFTAAALVAVCVLLNAMDWGTLKIAGEFVKKGALLFVFQYIYYLFEVGLVFLIVAFGQKFVEALLGHESRIPFGGIVLCCTWGAIHIVSQGSLYTGLGVMVFALLYGCIYLLLSRNARYAYLAMALAFMV